MPKEAASSFQHAFNDLDKNLTSYKIRSYGVTETSLEEVFLKLADLPPEVLLGGPTSMSKVDLKGPSAASPKLVSPEKAGVHSGIKFFKLCKIRFLIAMRSKSFWIFHLVIPLLPLILIGCILHAMNNPEENADYLPMTKVGAALKDTGIAPASNESSTENAVVASMEALIGQKFDKLSYDQLSNNSPHYFSFNFRDVPHR